MFLEVSQKGSEGAQKASRARSNCRMSTRHMHVASQNPSPPKKQTIQKDQVQNLAFLSIHSNTSPKNPAATCRKSVSRFALAGLVLVTPFLSVKEVLRSRARAPGDGARRWGVAWGWLPGRRFWGFWEARWPQSSFF